MELKATIQEVLENYEMDENAKRLFTNHLEVTLNEKVNLDNLKVKLEILYIPILNQTTT